MLAAAGDSSDLMASAVGEPQSRHVAVVSPKVRLNLRTDDP